MLRNDTIATAGILRRVRAALAELDPDASVNAVDRLDALYELHEITFRIREMERPNDEAGEQPVTGGRHCGTESAGRGRSRHSGTLAQFSVAGRNHKPDLDRDSPFG
jgi:hypothetical protein